MGYRLVAKRDDSAPRPALPAGARSPRRSCSGTPTRSPSCLPGAVLLASSPAVPVQVFRRGERAWGLQFHPEATPELVARWIADDAVLLEDLGLDTELLQQRVDDAVEELTETWQPVRARLRRAGCPRPGPGEAAGSGSPRSWRGAGRLGGSSVRRRRWPSASLPRPPAARPRSVRSGIS